MHWIIEFACFFGGFVLAWEDECDIVFDEVFCQVVGQSLEQRIVRKCAFACRHDNDRVVRFHGFGYEQKIFPARQFVEAHILQIGIGAEFFQSRFGGVGGVEEYF